jgi:hypothetical protein
MGLVATTRIIAGIGLILGLLGISLRFNEIMNRPYKRDLARAQGSRWRGALYAFTLGMAPWEKESGRLHWVAYIRGVLFHVGIFVALAALLASPWLDRLPEWVIWVAATVTGLGAVAGFGGVAMRWLDKNERALSVPDDYFSVIIASVFVLLAFVALIWLGSLWLFYLVSAVMLIYIPLSKIRHCVYFFYAKFFFGESYGRRGVLGHSR